MLSTTPEARRARSLLERVLVRYPGILHAGTRAVRPGDLADRVPGMRDLYDGIEGYLEAMETFLEVWSNMRVRLESVHELGPGRMLTVTRFTGEGAQRRHDRSADRRADRVPRREGREADLLVGRRGGLRRGRHARARPVEIGSAAHPWPRSRSKTRSSSSTATR